jgi:hypothetical protein
MKKDTLRAAVITVVVLIAYNFAVFMIPCLKTPTFWVSWGFTLLAFLISGIAIYNSLLKNPDAKSRFYGFPIAKIAFVYLVIQVAVGGICMALGHITPWWLATVLDAIILALTVIGLVSSEAVVAEIKVQDDKLKKNVTLMRTLQSKVNQIAAQSDDTALKALAEEFRYSDPVSSDALAEIELDLSAVVDELQAAVIDGDHDAAKQLCRKASAILAERNRLCKLNKN